MIGCWPRSFSSDAASVEKPVLVFFCGVRPSLSNRISRSWGVRVDVELHARRRPGSRSASAVALGRQLVVERAAARSTSTPTPTSSMRASTRTSGLLDVVVERAHALGVERGAERRRERGRRRAPAGPPRAPRRPPRRRGRAGPRRRRRRSGERDAGVAGQELAERVAGLGRVEQVGGDASCRARSVCDVDADGRAAPA